MQLPERLDQERLRQLCAGLAIAREIHVLESTASTNDVVAEFGRRGARAGLVVFAEQQTQGRGRLGRVWEAPPGQALLFSVLCRPQLVAHEWTRLSLGAAVGVARGLEQIVPCLPRVKWPNDVFLNGRKCAGILVESRVGGSSGDFAVVGIGLNVNQPAFAPPLEQTAISLRQVCGHLVDRHAVAAAVLRQLDRSISLLATDYAEILAEARARNFLRNRRVHCLHNGQPVVGVADDFDALGALLLRQDDGTVVRIESGEATLATADTGDSAPAAPA